MKATRHNGRSGKHGTYDAKHNDRRFDVENSEHIDAERTKMNVYWDCYQGYSLENDKDEQARFTFTEIEKAYYVEKYSDHVDGQNERNRKARHYDRVKTIDVEPVYGGASYLEKQDFIIMNQKKRIEEKQAVLDGLVMKIEDVNAVIEEAVDLAYEKACEVVTKRVKEETVKHGRVFSRSNVAGMRQFYMAYKDREDEIIQSGIGQFEQAFGIVQSGIGQLETAYKKIPFKLSWTHYQILMRIEDKDERDFYEKEAIRSNWNVSTLKRQFHSSLYERLALSRDKNDVMRLANEGAIPQKPEDILHTPYVLEFAGLEDKAAYHESDLESAVIGKMQKFLLELGKGFLFEQRQKRFTFNDKNFYVDLVLYNRLLRCYVLIDFKIDELTHQDLGQMQMYVNYYDRYEKIEGENPTIGILLCKQSDEALVDLTLPENANIYAKEYKLYLPDKKLLQKKLKEWLDEE